MAKTQKNKGIKGCTKNRPPTENKSPILTVPPTYISLGNTEKKIVVYIKNIGDARFNRRQFSIQNNIPRSTVKYALDRLISKGLIYSEMLGSYKLTEKGQNALNVLIEGVEPSRRECQGRANLSSHYLKFKLPIKDRSKYSYSNLNNLHPTKIIKNKLVNLEQDIIYFHDATIIINPKKIIINIHDLIGDDIDSHSITAINKAVSYTKKLQKIGIIAEGMYLQDGHFARVESYLSDWIEKHAEKYFLDLGDGRKFWIDHSDDKREDETNSEEVRERIDQFMDDMIKSQSLLSEVDIMKEVVGGLVKLKMLDLKTAMTVQAPQSKPDYFG